MDHSFFRPDFNANQPWSSNPMAHLDKMPDSVNKKILESFPKEENKKDRIEAAIQYFFVSDTYNRAKITVVFARRHEEQLTIDYNSVTMNPENLQPVNVIFPLVTDSTATPQKDYGRKKTPDSVALNIKYFDKDLDSQIAELLQVKKRLKQLESRFKPVE